MLCLCRYYPALRTLEQLEQTCLPKAGQYRFCSIMAENIPKLRIQIRDTAMSQLRDFLESIRKHSDKIGQTAMKQVHKHPETLWAEKVQLTCSHSQEMRFTKCGSVCLFLHCVRVALRDLQFKAILIYLVLGLGADPQLCFSFPTSF